MRKRHFGFTGPGGHSDAGMIPDVGQYAHCRDNEHSQIPQFRRATALETGILPSKRWYPNSPKKRCNFKSYDF